MASQPMELKTAAFWALAFLVATSMGGIQALSRSFSGRLIPPERSAEFFSISFILSPERK